MTTKKATGRCVDCSYCLKPGHMRKVLDVKTMFICDECSLKLVENVLEYLKIQKMAPDESPKDEPSAAKTMLYQK